MVCPVCGKKSQYNQCPDCGFDISQDYEGYPTLASLGEGMPSRAVFREDLKNLLRCRVCGGISFRVNALEDKLLCCNCGAETYYQGKGKGKPWSKNILRSDEVLTDANGKFRRDPYVEYPVFGSKYPRSQIASITFLNTVEGARADAWDVSEAGDGRVLAWAIPNGGLYDLYIGAEGGVAAGKSCKALFAGYINLKNIDNMAFFHTENVRAMDQMFRYCESLTSLDLSCLDTANVQNMEMMFYDCFSLTNLDLSNFDTTNVQNMGYIFYGCRSLTSLDLSSFDTGNVETMIVMFRYCESLTNLDLSRFDTSRVRSMRVMFGECTFLTNLDLSSFNTSNVGDATGMFENCNSLTSLDLSNFDTTNMWDMGAMFYNCRSLIDLNLSSFDTTNVRDMRSMFHNCPAGTKWQHLLK